MKLAFIAAAAFGLMLSGAQAEQTTSEKAAASANDAARMGKKKVHRVEEKVCAEGDTICLAKKAKHGGQEGSDYMKDKSKEAADKVN